MSKPQPEITRNDSKRNFSSKKQQQNEFQEVTDVLDTSIDMSPRQNIKGFEDCKLLDTAGEASAINYKAEIKAVSTSKNQNIENY